MPDEAAVIASKRALRDTAKARRALIPAAERQEGAASIAAQGLAFTGVSPPAVVSAFLSIGEEINPAPLMSRLQRDGWQIGLPVMVGKGRPLIFRAWSPGAPLRTVTWGIREPDETAPEVEPDVLLVPLLVFDRTGLRLGYGGGFYDRTLQALRRRKRVVTVGLAFSAQEVDAVPHLDYDERLDWVLTPEGPIRCCAH
jgi:5-formyltetrahydrofolate cyclo-ligase